MKRIIYVLLIIATLIGMYTAYQYIQYQNHLEALKHSEDASFPASPLDQLINAAPPAAAYYEHHQQMSSIASINPFLGSSIKKKLYFYDFTMLNEVLVDYYALTNHKDNLLATAKVEEKDSIMQQMQVNHLELCSRWQVFAKHLSQHYPDVDVSSALHHLCSLEAMSLSQKEVLAYTSDPTDY